MTLEQHISFNKEKNARRWTTIAAHCIRLSTIWYDRRARNTWLASAARIVEKHSRKPSTRAEAKRLLEILAHQS